MVHCSVSVDWTVEHVVEWTVECGTEDVEWEWLHPGMQPLDSRRSIWRGTDGGEDETGAPIHPSDTYIHMYTHTLYTHKMPQTQSQRVFHMGSIGVQLSQAFSSFRVYSSTAPNLLERKVFLGVFHMGFTSRTNVEHPYAPFSSSLKQHEED